MKAKNLILVGFIFSLSVAFCFGLEKGKGQEKIQEKAETKSLIRKDMLLRNRKDLKPPRRNIFTPRKSRIRSAEYDLQQSEAGPDATSRTASEGTISGINLNLRYIGYIDSGKKIVAVIIFQGKALAVEKGDVIAEGANIGKITHGEIEIIGPDSKARKYSFEGEEL